MYFQKASNLFAGKKKRLDDPPTRVMLSPPDPRPESINSQP